MRTRPAETQTLQRGPIIGMTANRTQEEQLIRLHVAVSVVAPRRRKASLQIQRAQHIPVQDRPGKVRNGIAESRDNTIGDRILDAVRVADCKLAQLGPHSDSHNVPSPGASDRS